LSPFLQRYAAKSPTLLLRLAGHYSASSKASDDPLAVRLAHQAVHSLALNLQFKGYGYIVEADIKGFFDNLDHDWLMVMLNRLSGRRTTGVISNPEATR
jgi:hypothetical protein